MLGNIGLMWGSTSGSGNTLLDSLEFWFDGATVNGAYKLDRWWKYHLNTAGSVPIGANGYEFNGVDGNALVRPVRDTNTETLGTISGCVTVRLNTIASNGYIVGKDGNKSSEYGWRVYYNQAGDCFNVEFADASGAAVQTVQVGSSITPGTDHVVCYGYDAALGEVWASVDGGAETVLPVFLTQGVNVGYIGLGSRPDNAVKWTLDGSLKNVGLWTGYRLSTNDQDLLSGGANFEDLDGNINYGFAWDFEAASSYVGRLTSTGGYETIASTDYATNGTSSIHIEPLTFSQVQIFADSIQPWIGRVDEGRIDVNVRLVSFGGGAMVFQLDGKQGSGAALDTNNGLQVYLNDDGGNRGLRIQYGLPNISALTSGYNLPLNQWVMLSARYKAASASNTLELYADDVLIASTTTPLPVLSNSWFVHMSIGNDTFNVAEFYLDDLFVTPVSRLS